MYIATARNDKTRAMSERNKILTEKIKIKYLSICLQNVESIKIIAEC